MKKLLYISFIFAVLIAFASCEKHDVKLIDRDDPFSFLEGDNYDCGTKDPIIGDGLDSDGDDGGGIVDPDEDDDDLDDDGGGIVDPDEDDDDLDDEGK